MKQKLEKEKNGKRKRKGGLNYKREERNKRVGNKAELKEELDDKFIELKLHLNFMLSPCFSHAHRFIALNPFLNPTQKPDHITSQDKVLVIWSVLWIE